MYMYICTHMYIYNYTYTDPIAILSYVLFLMPKHKKECTKGTYLSSKTKFCLVRNILKLLDVFYK